MARALFIAAFFFTMTPLLISLQWLLDKLNLPGWGFIASNYYRVLCSLLHIRVHVNGEPVRGRAVLFVSNHVSWTDILVIGSIAPVAFVAKREVAEWPLVGITAKAQRSVFVDRTRRNRTGDTVGEIVKRLGDGVSVVLFAEGTSSDGNRVLPFRSALLGAVGDIDSILIQPMSICYTGQHGIPMGRQHRPLVAWYGDAGCSRCPGHLWRASYRRPRHGPQGHDQTPGKCGTPPFGGRPARAAASCRAGDLGGIYF
ncbi:MAG TPA: lysophospholipid acyltransferase family protein [Pseudolabrys sp.]|nr:lysophospholipid acyltransferase family protein [Pseudolabrys sp.]